MPFRTFSAAGAWVALAAATLLPGAASARDLAVVTLAAPFGPAEKDVYFTPFTTTTGISIAASAATGGLAAVRNHAAGGAPDTWDVVLLPAPVLFAACEDGLLEKLNWAQIGGRDKYLPQAVSDCGAGAEVASTVLSWDKDKFQATPAWSDFWDVARYPGKRGLRRTARSNLEIALLADGVGPGDIYRTLRSEEGVDRAFRKLDQIKPYLVWWTAEGQPMQLLGTGEVLMSSAPSVTVGQANAAGHRRFGEQWAGSLYTVRSWAMMKGTAAATEAVRFIAFAGDPARQAAAAALAAFGPTAKGAAELLTPDQQAVSPSAPANLQNALQIDEAFWLENGEKLSARFEAWLAH